PGRGCEGDERGEILFDLIDPGGDDRALEVGVLAGSAQPREVLQAAARAARVEAGEEGPRSLDDSARVRAERAVVERVAAFAAIEIDDRREVDVEIEEAERAPDRPARFERVTGRLGGQARGARRGPDDPAQAVDPPPFGVDREDRSGQRAADGADERAELFRALAVAAEEDDPARAMIGEEALALGIEIHARQAHPERLGGTIDAV